MLSETFTDNSKPHFISFSFVEGLLICTHESSNNREEGVEQRMTNEAF